MCVRVSEYARVTLCARVPTREHACLHVYTIIITQCADNNDVHV